MRGVVAALVLMKHHFYSVDPILNRHSRNITIGINLEWDTWLLLTVLVVYIEAIACHPHAGIHEIRIKAAHVGWVADRVSLLFAFR